MTGLKRIAALLAGGRSFVGAAPDLGSKRPHVRDNGRAPAENSASTAAVLSQDVVLHHLRLFGLRARVPVVIADAGTRDIARAQDLTQAGETVVALDPGMEFCQAFGATRHEDVASAGSIFACPLAGEKPWRRLRTLHAAGGFSHPRGVRIVTADQHAAAAWLWIASGRAGVLLIGTKLADDLVRYRQGDPAQAKNRTDAPMWGYAGERPFYLFEPQLAGEDPNERHADWWTMALACALEHHAGFRRAPMLPGGAPGAIIATGDDEQAHVPHYSSQLAALGSLPITYFMYPFTERQSDNIPFLLSEPRVDLGLHPDALDAPEQYAQKLDAQAKWFRDMTGRTPLSLRNHGFLNEGYWGHLPHWRRQAIRISSNLPGVNGRVLNGSLLPARMAWDGQLTEHWNVLTAIGDGVVFALKYTAEQSAACIKDLAERIRASGVPGTIVLNLHPVNIESTKAMHQAVRDVARSGFLAWSMRDCLDWFESVDAGSDRAA